MRERTDTSRAALAAWLLAIALLLAPAISTAQEHDSAEGEEHREEYGEEHSEKHSNEHASRLSDEVIPLQLEGFPQRPKPIVELGEPFLGTGTLRPGFELPTGAIWQPSLLVFGSLRTAVQSAEVDGARRSEWANRLDLFVNLQLSGSERLVIGLRPLDRDGRFTSYTFDSNIAGIDEEFNSELNGQITSLFFEGDFGEIFPNLSRDDFRATDIGFTVGRQPMLFQEGILIDDAIDGMGFTRNTLQPKNTSNFRTTFFWGWNEVGRGSGGDNREDDSAQLFALLTSTDLRTSTIDADLVYVSSDDPQRGDLITAGVSAIQRIGKANTSLRLLASSAVDEETAFATDGVLLFTEASWTPASSLNFFYFNTFWAVDEFSSAARGPASGGPLGRAGINFAAVGLGSFGAPLSSRAKDVAGGAVGYQWFFHNTRRQLIVELGGRVGTEDDVANAVAATARYQAAFGRRFVLVIDAIAGRRESLRAGAGDQDFFGGRLELVLKF